MWQVIHEHMEVIDIFLVLITDGLLQPVVQIQGDEVILVYSV